MPPLAVTAALMPVPQDRSIPAMWSVRRHRARRYGRVARAGVEGPEIATEAGSGGISALVAVPVAAEVDEPLDEAVPLEK